MKEIPQIVQDSPPLPVTDLLTLNKDVIAGSQKQLFFLVHFFFSIFGICLALKLLNI